MKLRGIEPGDRQRLEQWIESDPDHRGKTQAAFFSEKEQGVEQMVFEDESGVVFYVRISRVLRVDMQFGPNHEVATARVMRTLQHGFDWIMKSAQRVGMRQVIFESSSHPLVIFCKRRFGFRQSAHELIRDIAVDSSKEG